MSTSAMADMSKSIRECVDRHSPGETMKEVPDELLREFEAIVGAFYFDLKDERQRRGLAPQFQ